MKDFEAFLLITFRTFGLWSMTLLYPNLLNGNICLRAFLRLLQWKLGASSGIFPIVVLFLSHRAQRLSGFNKNMGLKVVWWIFTIEILDCIIRFLGDQTIWQTARFFWRFFYDLDNFWPKFFFGVSDVIESFGLVYFLFRELRNDWRDYQ